jgi:hypothetical protein
MNKRDDSYDVMWFRSRRIAENMIPVAAKSFCGTGGMKCFAIETVETGYVSVKRFYVLTWRFDQPDILPPTTPKLIGAFLKGYMKAKGIRD